VTFFVFFATNAPLRTSCTNENSNSNLSRQFKEFIDLENGGVKKLFKILAEFSSLELLVLLFQEKRT